MTSVGVWVVLGTLFKVVYRMGELRVDFLGLGILPV